jgi:hypothetical protein
METIVGFAVGYLVGTRQGREGLERLRASVQSIKNSPEVRKLAAEAVAVAGTAVRQASTGGIKGLGGTVGDVTDILVRRAVASREGSRAA